MVDAIGDHDVFKLISLRGPIEGLIIDPGADGLDLPVADELAGVDLRQPPERMRRMAAEWVVLRDDELAALPWASLPGGPGVEGSLRELLGTDVVAGAPLHEYGTQSSFLEAYARLAGSWIRLELKRRWRVMREKPTLLDAHERLIRPAHVIRQLGRGRRSLVAPLIGRLAVAKVIVPRRLVSRRSRVVPDRGASPKELRDARRREITAAKQAFIQHQSAIGRLESIQEKVARTLAEWGGGRDLGESIALDATFYTSLDRRLTAAERATLGERTDPDSSRRPTLLGDLTSALDVMADLTAANSLCSRIRVFEEEEVEQLPTARTPQPGDRPSVGALGWGDLVVVRERLVGYTAREIAHIENVMAGEVKMREHERSLRTEELIETETLRETQSERDLQTSDRFELQAEAEKTVDTQFAVDTGVNTSGRYGLTNVATSLATGFTRGVQESRRQSTELAKEVVTRSVEKVRESVRELRRRLTVEQIRELSRHTLDNIAPGPNGEPPEHRVGLYYWVEKIHELELRQYGKRLMVEFHIPEPGLSLIQQAAPRLDKRKPADLAFGPHEISSANYLCLTQRYGATEVEPPPPLLMQAGMAWASTVDASIDDLHAEDAETGLVKIPAGYAPVAGQLVLTGRGKTNDNADDWIHAQVSVGGIKVLDSGAAPRATYVGVFAFDEPRQVNPDSDGLPVSIRIAGHDDRTATVNVTVTCKRGPEAYQRWQLRTYERIRLAHALLVREYEEAKERGTFADVGEVRISGRPPAQNRRIERDELAKWAIKMLRVDPFDFDAVVAHEGIQEIDPVASDEQALTVRFFEEAFEWREMSYFLYPYYWARRSTWALRAGIQVDADPQHEAFLSAGAARVIVPVTPGYEDRVLAYLDSDPSRPDAERIPPPVAELPEDSQYPDLWLELLLSRNEELALGSGALSVIHGEPEVTITHGDTEGANEVGRWKLSDVDVGRELHIGAARYQIAAVAEDGASFSLDRPYEGATDASARYAVGSVRFGAPWLVRIPTTLVVLSNKQAGEVFGS